MEATEVIEMQLPTVPQGDEAGAMIEIESARAIQEVQAAMIVAKRFPRDQTAAYKRIKEACKRKSLAKEAMYAYPRGGSLITGPSIRLAEVLAQNWGNLQFGIRELSQRVTPGGGVSEVQAFAWDLETNTLQSKTFQVEHVRFTKTAGKKRLSDPRDIYELIANQGARRVRACILGVIPGDIVEEAVKQCEKTMEGDEKPIAERVRDMVEAFQGIGITQEMLEKRLGHKVDATISTELVTLGKIYRSIKDGMAKPEDFFDVPREEQQAASDLQAKVDAATGEHIAESEPTPEPEPETNDEKIPCAYPGCKVKAKPGKGMQKHLTMKHGGKPYEPPTETEIDDPGADLTALRGKSEKLGEFRNTMENIRKRAVEAGLETAFYSYLKEASGYANFTEIDDPNFAENVKERMVDWATKQAV